MTVVVRFLRRRIASLLLLLMVVTAGVAWGFAWRYDPALARWMVGEEYTRTHQVWSVRRGDAPGTVVLVSWRHEPKTRMGAGA